MNISHSGTFIVIRMLPGKVRHTRTKMPLCFQVRPLVYTTYRTKMLLYSYLYYTFVLDWIHQNNYTQLPYISIKIPGIEFLTLIHWMMRCIRLSTVCIGVRTRETRGASSLPPPCPQFFSLLTHPLLAYALLSLSKVSPFWYMHASRLSHAKLLVTLLAPYFVLQIAKVMNLFLAY